MSIEYLVKQLGDNETILHQARQHWMFLLRRSLVPILFFVGIFLFVYFLVRWTPEQPWLAWGYLLLLIPLAIFGWHVLQWRAKVYIVTSRRVARVAGVLNKNVKDSRWRRSTTWCCVSRSSVARSATARSVFSRPANSD